MVKASKLPVPAVTVRMRRVYFDCRFGQLHVRTAFPTTGGFDEQVTLFCLHAAEGSSRTFSRFLPLIADERSVYAPDLPGCGESDARRPARSGAPARSRICGRFTPTQIDVLGFQEGCAVAVELARAGLIGAALGARRRDARDQLPRIAQPADHRRASAAAPNPEATAYAQAGDECRLCRGCVRRRLRRWREIVANFLNR